MKILKIIFILVASLALVGGAGYLYASSGVKSKPGYIKLNPPVGDSVDPLLAINIGPNGVKPVRWLFEKVAESSDYDHEIPKQLLNNVLHDLQGIQLRLYEVDGNRQVFDNAIKESGSSLKNSNWKPLITVREDEEHIVIMQYGDDTNIQGLSVMVSSPDMAVFLNLIGSFNLEKIAQHVTQLN